MWAFSGGIALGKMASFVWVSFWWRASAVNQHWAALPATGITCVIISLTVADAVREGKTRHSLDKCLCSHSDSIKYIYKNLRCVDINTKYIHIAAAEEVEHTCGILGNMYINLTVVTN